MKQGVGKKPKTLVIFHLAFFIFHLCLIGSDLNCPDGGLELAVRMPEPRIRPAEYGSAMVVKMETGK